MMRFVAMLLMQSLFAGHAWCQAQNFGKAKEPHNRATLADTAVVKVESELASTFAGTLRCDNNGNLYLRKYQMGRGLDAPVEKFTMRGEKAASFDPEKVTGLVLFATSDYAVAPDFSFYLLTRGYPKDKTEDAAGAYVLEFDKDGTYRSAVRLEAKIRPKQLAVFASGNFLVSGMADSDDPGKRSWSVPFTGVFHSDGTLLKEVRLQDDKSIQESAEKGNDRVVDPLSGANHAVELGHAVLGGDGNVYLMRKTSPAVVYAIAEAGVVVRRIAIEPDDFGAMPDGLQAGRRRFAVLFWDNKHSIGTFKVLNMSDGKVVATYQGKDMGPAFACYSDDTDTFTFLNSEEDGHLAFEMAQPH